MNSLNATTQRLMELLGHDETPFGVCYTDVKPEGYGPKPGEIFTKEREDARQIDWKRASTDFKCFVGSLWLARKKKKAAWISHEECGCMGGGFYTGLYAPYLYMNVLFISSGIPGTPIEGEHFLPNPESMRAFMDDCTPPPAKGKYCVLKPLEQFTDAEPPLSVTFFARGEVLTGLHSLTVFTTGNHNAVVTPFGATCTSIVAWPFVYERRGMECAVLGGFDISTRKFLKTDEFTFSIPLSLYNKMLDVMETSALTRDRWNNVRSKVMKSRRTWGGDSAES